MRLSYKALMTDILAPDQMTPTAKAIYWFLRYRESAGLGAATRAEIAEALDLQDHVMRPALELLETLELVQRAEMYRPSSPASRAPLAE